MAPTNIDGRNDLHFVYIADGSKTKSLEDDHLARSHTAKVNRLRNRQRGTIQHGLEPCARVRPADRSREPLSVTEYQSSWRVKTARKVTPRSSTPRALSPVLGAVSAYTFAPGVDRADGEVIAYYCCSVLKNYMSSAEAQWYIQAYCEHPVVFHAIHYAVANHQDRVRGYISETTSSRIIAHKGKALLLMRNAIDAYCAGSMEIGLLLLAITSVMRNEPDPSQLAPDRMLLFRPHVPNVDNVAIYGRGKAAQTANVHRDVVARLLIRPENLLTIGTPGLTKAIAGHNLIVSSRDLIRPMYPNVWANLGLRARILSGYRADTGRGFKLMGLPPTAEQVYQYLSAVDKALSDHAASGKGMDWLQPTVCDAHHRLMSLLPWSEMAQEERSSCGMVVYECCRLTTILYSNGVIFPMPVASGWHLEVLRQLRRLFEIAGCGAWPMSSSSLRIWSLYIAAIAAAGTPESAYFEGRLQHLLDLQYIVSWDAAQQELSAFLWTNCACDAAGYSIWEQVVAGSGLHRPGVSR